MNYDAQKFLVIKNEEIAAGIFDMLVENKALASIAKAGQFAHILVPGKTLRRPISICDADKSCLRLVYQVKGEGTEILSKVKEGEYLDIIAPLGKGFDIKEDKRYCFIGGGIGVPPMLYASKMKERPIVITGFRNKDLVILQSDFRKDNCDLYLTTDDGTAGKKAFVTDVLKEKLGEIDEVCACGPMPMLKAISEICNENNIPCQVSLEERMGCGIGACLVCACKVKRNDGSQDYVHVCKDGPVFDSKEVVF
ncbi:MAG: dihydroorotate dehydrogenase electron transfer subunit [Oscillospiraceae bacterium]|nr:dihydroorotate dehydrogenase electron transfer subunit [Oscillospiraceae bacterium]